MTIPLPKWIQTRYALLWNKFKDEEFDFTQAEKTIKGDSGVHVCLSELKKSGWLSIRLDSDDSRKRIYRLKKPERAIVELAKNG